MAAALVWSVSPFSVTFAIDGLETSLVVLLLTAVAYFYLTRRFTPMALCAGLSLLTRPDTLLLVAPLALGRLVQVARARQLLKWTE